MAHVVVLLPSKHEALSSSNPSTPLTKKVQILVFKWVSF
jgi:hypothetical protein